MTGRARINPINLAIPLLLLLGACAAPPAATPAPTATSSATTDSLLTLSPVPLMLKVPLSVADSAWIAPLTGAYISQLAPAAAVQVQYRRGVESDAMVANLLWFNVPRFQQLMASAEPPKGITIGYQGDHVLFVQPALDMPFDPQSKRGLAYGALVERARDFRWYTMSDRARTLVRPCVGLDSLPTVPVDKDMLAAISTYFTAKGLAPIRLEMPDARVFDVFAQELGTHTCANPDGGLGAYSGAVPTGALEAVIAYVAHRPYPVTGGASTFVTLARMPGLGWLVVGEGTGP